MTAFRNASISALSRGFISRRPARDNLQSAAGLYGIFFFILTCFKARFKTEYVILTDAGESGYYPFGLPIYKSLHYFRGQALKSDTSKLGLYLVSDLVGLCSGFYPFQVSPGPCVHPLSNSHFDWIDLFSQANSCCGLFEFLGGLFLCLSCNAPLHLLPRAWVKTRCKACLPIGVLFPRAGRVPFADRTGACC